MISFAVNTAAQRPPTLLNGPENSHNCLFPLENLTPSNKWFLGPTKWHVYHFCRFCRSHECDQQTHRQTDHATSISPHVTQCMSNNTSYCNSLSIDHMQHLMNCFMSQLLLRPWLVNSSCWLGNPPTKAKVNSLVAINKLNGLKCTTNVILYVMFVYQEKQISRVWCEDRSLLKDEAASSRCK